MPRRRESSDKLTLRLVDLPEGETAPKLAVYAVDQAGATIHRAEVSAGGAANLPAAALDKAEQVVVGPSAKDVAELERAQQLAFHTDHIRDLIAQGAELEIPIGKIISLRRCVDGSVTRCIPFPYLIDELVAQSSRVKVAALQHATKTEGMRSTMLTLAKAEDAAIARSPLRPPFPLRCTR